MRHAPLLANVVLVHRYYNGGGRGGGGEAVPRQDHHTFQTTARAAGRAHNPRVSNRSSRGRYRACVRGIAVSSGTDRGVR